MARIFKGNGDYDGRTKGGKLGKKIRWTLTAIVIIVFLIMALAG